MKKNEKGFGVVEILLVIVVIGLLGVVGWMFFSKQKDSKTSNNATTSPTQQTKEEEKTPPKQVVVDEYEGWKQCKDDVEKISFKYPISWTGTCEPTYTDGANGTRGGMSATSSAKFPEVYTVQLFSGSANGRYTGSDKADTVVDVVPLSTTFNGKELYAVFFADEWTEKGQILAVLLSDTKYSLGQSVVARGVHSITRPSTYIVMNARMGDYAHQGQNFSVAEYKASSDYQDVVKLLKSFKSE